MNYLSFDTETTGLGADARIIELAVVFFTNGEVVESWDSLFWPDGVDFEDPNVQKALEVNHITVDQLEGKPTFEDSISDVVRALEGEVIWVAHNTPFDLRMLRQEFDRTKTAMPTPSYALDTMMLDKVADKWRKGSRRLDVVSKVWGVELGEAHRAHVDARACGEILWAMFQSHSMPPNVDIAYGMQKNARDEWDAWVAKKYQNKS